MATSEHLLYPGECWTLLLKACLIRGSMGGNAWDRWVKTVGDATALMSRPWKQSKRWWPLLWTALHRNQAQVPRGVLTILKSAYTAEMVRFAYCKQILARALLILGKGGFDPVLVKGMALAKTVYERPALRHCHELEVLICSGELTSAARAINSDFSMVHTGAAEASSRVTLLHRSGLPLLLRTVSSTSEWFNDTVDFSFSKNAELQCLFPAPEFLLFQVCYEADQRNDFPFAWICDGWHLLSLTKSMNLDLLKTIIDRSNAADTLRERLNYLQHTFGSNYAQRESLGPAPQ